MSIITALFLAGMLCIYATVAMLHDEYCSAPIREHQAAIAAFEHKERLTEIGNNNMLLGIGTLLGRLQKLTIQNEHRPLMPLQTPLVQMFCDRAKHFDTYVTNRWDFVWASVYAAMATVTGKIFLDIRAEDPTKSLGDYASNYFEIISGVMAPEVVVLCKYLYRAASTMSEAIKGTEASGSDAKVDAALDAASDEQSKKTIVAARRSARKPKQGGGRGGKTAPKPRLARKPLLRGTPSPKKCAAPPPKPTRKR